MISAAESKQCTKCGEVKSLGEFYVKSKRKDGTPKLKGYCKECNKDTDGYRNSARRRCERKGIEYKPQSNCKQCGKLKKVLRDGLCLECNPVEKEIPVHRRIRNDFEAAELGDWLVTIKSQRAKLNEGAKVIECEFTAAWLRKVRAVINGQRLRQRQRQIAKRKTADTRNSKKCKTFIQAVRKQRSSLAQQFKYHSKSQWEKRVRNAFQNWSHKRKTMTH
jgi:hypothetical protein